MEWNKVGRSIQTVRESKMMTREDFAQHIGVLRKTVVDWEEGKALPTAEQILAIAEFGGVDPRSLVDEPRSEDTVETPAEQTQPKKDHRMALGIVLLVLGVTVLFVGVQLLGALTAQMGGESAPAVSETAEAPLPECLVLAELELPKWDLDGDGKKELVNAEQEDILFVSGGAAYGLAEPLAKGQTLTAQDGVFIVKNAEGESRIYSVLRDGAIYPAG